jgi:predicted MFS family arabinose efflux permease
VAAVAEPTAAQPVIDVTDDRLAARNAVVLAVAQALAGGNNTVIVATTSIIASMLAPDPSLATLPISFMVGGMWLGTLPVGALSKAYGRRFALQIGSIFGALSGFISLSAVLTGSFWLLLAGTACGGLYAAAHQSYRFAATDTASPQFRPKAVAWVLAGGVFAGVLGPQLVIFTKDIWPTYLFAATFISQSLCAIAAAFVLTFLNVPRPNVSHSLADGRPLSAIVVQPKFLVAVVCGLASYTMMNMVMTSAPLAMVMCNHTVSEAALGIQWHVIGMYAPSFITGSLIARFGVRRMMAIGLTLMVVAASIELEGIAIWNFWVGLTVLGVGWNFAFISATTLVTECHDPHERNKVQAFNDFLVFGSMALGSFASGALLAHYGWTAVNDMVFPVILVAAALLTWGSLAQRPKVA